MKKLFLSLCIIVATLPAFSGDFALEIQAKIKELGLNTATHGEIALYHNPKNNNVADSLAAYIYNVYVHLGAKGSFKMPSDLDLSFLGTLDPVFDLAAGDNVLRNADYDKAHIARLNRGQDEAIKNNLKLLFAAKLGLNYDDKDTKLSRLEDSFLDELQEQLFYHLAYVRNDSFKSGPIDKDAILQLSALVQESRRQDEGCKSRYPDCYSKDLCDECALGSYTLSRLTQVGDKYGAWEVINMHEILAIHKHDGYPLERADGESEFIGYKGKKYAPWRYHAAALITLKKGGDLSFVVVDKLLLTGPVLLQEWTDLFHQETVFMAQAYARSFEYEALIFNKDNTAFYAK